MLPHSFLKFRKSKIRFMFHSYLVKGNIIFSSDKFEHIPCNAKPYTEEQFSSLNYMTGMLSLISVLCAIVKYNIHIYIMKLADLK